MLITRFFLPQSTLNSLVVCLWELRIRISMLSVSSALHAAHHWKIKAISICTINCIVTFTLAWLPWTVHHQMQTVWSLSPSQRKYETFFNPFHPPQAGLEHYVRNQWPENKNEIFSPARLSMKQFHLFIECHCVRASIQRFFSCSPQA